MVMKPAGAIASIAGLRARVTPPSTSSPSAESRRKKLISATSPLSRSKKDVKATTSSTIWALPNDILLEIFEWLPGRELKSLRLVCKLFSALITPRLFRSLRYSFSTPDDYVHCSKHGWFEYQPGRSGSQKLNKRPRPCNGSSLYKLNVPRLIRCSRLEDTKGKDDLMYSSCPYFSSTTARKEEKAPVNPFVDCISTDLDNERMVKMFKSATQFTLTFPHSGRKKWRPRGTVTLDPKATFTMFTAKVFPRLLAAMPNLKTLRIDTRPDAETVEWMPFVLLKTTSLCAFARPEIQIHVAILIRDWTLHPETPNHIVRALHGISLLTTNSYWSPPEFDKEIDDLCERCPKLQGDEVLKEVNYTDISNGPAALDDKVFIGPTKERDNMWYMPTDEEVITKLKGCRRTRSAMDFMMRTWFAFDFDKTWTESVHSEIARLLSK